MQVKGYDRGKEFLLDVEEIDSRGNLLRVDAARQYKSMFMAAKADGIILRANYGWRSMMEQRRLRNNYMIRMKAWNLLPAIKRGRKPLAPAKPGYSNHQAGIAVDINRAHDDPDGRGPIVGTTDAWLASNAGRFGFVLPYPVEPWHWEYRPKNADSAIAA